MALTVGPCDAHYSRHPAAECSRVRGVWTEVSTKAPTSTAGPCCPARREHRASLPRTIHERRTTGFHPVEWGAPARCLGCQARNLSGGAREHDVHLPLPFLTFALSCKCSHSLWLNGCRPSKHHACLAGLGRRAAEAHSTRQHAAPITSGCSVTTSALAGLRPGQLIRYNPCGRVQSERAGGPPGKDGPLDRQSRNLSTR